MRHLTFSGFGLCLLGVLVGCGQTQPQSDSIQERSKAMREIRLPPPQTNGDVALEEALQRRRSVRDFTSRPLTDRQLGQLAWSAQGVTNPQGYRNAPSAGALYPLELYIVIESGLFHYQQEDHVLLQLGDTDLRPALYRAALLQDAVQQAPAVIVFTTVSRRTSRKYGARAERYIDMEVGHAAQNLLLQATALGLGAVPVGAFDDNEVHAVLDLPAEEQPRYLVPVGHPAE